MPRPPKTEAAPILGGWKEIATYLGKGVRTVQRYERLMGLPVRRPAGKSRGSVVATKSELDAWVTASPIREAFQLTTSGESQAHNLEAIKHRIEQMSALRDAMAALRAELRTSMESLRHSIESIRADLRPGRWDTPYLGGLDDNPQTRRLLHWMSNESKSLPTEAKGRKVS